MILPILFAQPSPDGDANVTLDDERLQDTVPKGLQKVELDLDDALFLEFEEKEPPPATPAEPEPASEPKPEPARPDAPPPAKIRIRDKFTRNKLVIFAIAAALCLLLGASGAFLFMTSGLQPENLETQKGKNQTTAGEKHDASSLDANSSAEGQIAVYPFDRFQVEYTVDSQVRFLICRFSIPDANAALRLELQNKDVVIRNGIYHYLKNAPVSFLNNSTNPEKLKTDIVAIINTFVTNGDVSSVHFEEYVVK
jgi:flagellar FliL protein